MQLLAQSEKTYIPKMFLNCKKKIRSEQSQLQVKVAPDNYFSNHHHIWYRSFSV